MSGIHTTSHLSPSGGTVAEILRSVFFAVILFLPSSASAGGVEREDKACAAAISVDLNSTLRGYADKQGESFLVRLDLPSAGLLSVSVATPGFAEVEPRLGFVGSGCGGPQAGPEPTFLERSATHLVLVAPESSSYIFRVASEDPLISLRDFKLESGFAPTGLSIFAKDEDDDEELEIEVEPSIHVVQHESRSLHSKIEALCRTAEIDDHGDSFTCATFLIPGQIMAGEIRNGWGDDADVFLFILGSSGGSRLWSVEIETTGDADTFAGLYDRSGARLERGDDGIGSNFRIVRTLRSGTYFVRVVGRQGSEGLYTMRVNAVPE